VDPVLISIIEGSLVVWVVGVLRWVELVSFISPDGIPKARNVGEDEVPALCQFPVCPFRGKGFEDVPFLVRGCGRNV